MNVWESDRKLKTKNTHRTKSGRFECLLHIRFSAVMFELNKRENKKRAKKNTNSNSITQILPKKSEQSGKVKVHVSYHLTELKHNVNTISFAKDKYFDNFFSFTFVHFSSCQQNGNVRKVNHLYFSKNYIDCSTYTD